jgi:hypothetical protein
VIGARLFIRSRRWTAVTATTLVAAGLIVMCSPLNVMLNPRGGYLIAVAAQVPVIPAIAIQAALASPLPRQDQLARRRLSPWRLSHVVGLTAFAAGAIAVAAVPFAGAEVDAYAHQGAIALVRNLLAMTGAAHIGAAIVGPRFGWVLPLSWLVLPFLFLPTRLADTAGVLALIVQGDDAVVPLAVACTTWVVGVALASIDARIRWRA